MKSKQSREVESKGNIPRIRGAGPVVPQRRKYGLRRRTDAYKDWRGRKSGKKGKLVQRCILPDSATGLRLGGIKTVTIKARWYLPCGSRSFLSQKLAD